MPDPVRITVVWLVAGSAPIIDAERASQPPPPEPPPEPRP